MDYRFDEHAIVSENELIKLLEKNYLISEVINLDNEKVFISFNKNFIIINPKYFKKNFIT